MHWIQVQGDTVARGQTNPPDGDLFFVDSTGAHAFKGGKLFKDGKPATHGTHTIKFNNGDTLDIAVDASGNAKRGQLKKGGA